MTTIRVPTVGLWRDSTHRYFASYQDGAPIGPLPGVTGVIGIMDKPAIVGWAKNEVAKAAVGNMPMLSEMLDKGGPDAAVKWLAAIPGYQRDTAADVGSLVHILAERVARKQETEVPPALVPYLVGFRRWMEEHSPKLVSLEQLVCLPPGEPESEYPGYGGTFDIVAEIDGVMTLLDIKTWRKRPVAGGDMYAETAMQLAAYSRATFIGAPGDPKRHRMPKVEAYAVLHLRPDLYESGYSVIPYHVTDADYDGFLGLLAAYRWKQTRAKVVIGEPLPLIEKVKAVA